jgi:hypothetical protein
MRHNSHLAVLFSIFLQHFFHLSSTSSQLLVVFPELLPSQQFAYPLSPFLRIVLVMTLNCFLVERLVPLAQVVDDLPGKLKIVHVREVENRVLLYFVLYGVAHIAAVSERFA